MTTINTNNVSNNLLDAMNRSKAGASGGIDAAQDRFMKLLVTQMKNQDPLNPMDNAQMTSQIAQLSTVTGIEKLNVTLQSLVSSAQLGQSYQAANMIGHGVLVPGNKVTLQQGMAVYGLELPNSADNVTVTIRNAGGQVVREYQLGEQEAGTRPFQWNGATDSGAVAPDGQYSIEVKAVVGTQAVTVNPLSYGEVRSVSNVADGVMLNLSDSSSIRSSDVRQIF